jgi:hypothetical protein
VALAFSLVCKEKDKVRPTFGTFLSKTLDEMGESQGII